jgi:glycosyltransferase involved in cell wall biosynthesis
MSGFEENEISKAANGGTEITKRSIAALVDKELASNFQIIPSRVREIEFDKIRIYWAHDLPEDPEANHLKDENSRNRFHKIVFSSNWQMNDYIVKLGIPQDFKLAVIETPIEPFPVVQKPSDVINLIHFSTPQRGLELLVPAFDRWCQENPSINAHLHVFSSFKIYGWADADKRYQSLYNRIIGHPKMTYHGYSAPETLRKQLLDSHILVYPCIWKETSCRVLMESMSAGLLCIHPNLAALSDTGGGLTTSYQFQDDPQQHFRLFYHSMDSAIKHIRDEGVQPYLNFVKMYADNRFNLKTIAQRWELLLKELLGNFPTVESRKPPEVIQRPSEFVYKT